MSEKVEEPLGYLPQEEEEGRREKEWVSSRAREKMQVLCGPFFPQPLHNTSGNEQQYGSGGRGRWGHRGKHA